jgi:hypothetical protein
MGSRLATTPMTPILTKQILKRNPLLNHDVKVGGFFKVQIQPLR